MSHALSPKPERSIHPVGSTETFEGGDTQKRENLWMAGRPAGHGRQAARIIGADLHLNGRLNRRGAEEEGL